MYEIKRRKDANYMCPYCKDEGGIYDCGWWYKCTCPKACDEKSIKKETNEQ